ncbi:MAG: hypothetical protein IJZ75_00060 [Clostridia bacterium]|nr:hypothetical protein [Clostridia bacterium]
MKLFFKSFYISLILSFCILFALFGVAKAYESIRLIGFGEYKKAVEIDSDSIRILDFEYKFENS